MVFFKFKSPFQENIQLNQSSNYPSGCPSSLKRTAFLLHKTVSGNGVKLIYAQGVGVTGAPIQLWLRSIWRGGVGYIPQQLNLARSLVSVLTTSASRIFSLCNLGSIPSAYQVVLDLHPQTSHLSSCRCFRFSGSLLLSLSDLCYVANTVLIMAMLLVLHKNM